MFDHIQTHNPILYKTIHNIMSQLRKYWDFHMKSVAKSRARIQRRPKVPEG